MSRSWRSGEWTFDVLVAVVLESEDLSLVEGWEIDVATAKKHAARTEHVNGWRLTLRQVRSVGLDVTDRLRTGEALLG